jgi:hypothetical protein
MDLGNLLSPELRPVLLPIILVAVGYVLGRIASGIVVALLRFLGLYEWGRFPWLEQRPAGGSRPNATASTSPPPVETSPGDSSAAGASAASAPADRPAVVPASPHVASRTRSEAADQPVSTGEPADSPRLERLISGLVTLAGVLGGVWFSADILHWEGTRAALQRMGTAALSSLGIIAITVWVGELLIKPIVLAAVPQGLRNRLDRVLDSASGELTVSQLVQSALALALYLAVVLLGAQFAMEAGEWKDGQATISTLWNLLALFGSVAVVWGLAWTMIQVLGAGREEGDAWSLSQTAVLGVALLVSFCLLSGQFAWVIGPAILVAAGFAAWPLRLMIEDRAGGWYLQANRIREVWYRGELLELREIRPCATEVVDLSGKSWVLPNRLLVGAVQKGPAESSRRPFTPPTRPPSSEELTPFGRPPVITAPNPSASDSAAASHLRPDGDVRPPTAPAPAEAPISLPLRPAIEWNDAADGYSINEPRA